MAGVSIMGQIARGRQLAKAQNRPGLRIGDITRIEVPYKKDPHAISLAISKLIDHASAQRAQQGIIVGVPHEFDLYARPFGKAAQVEVVLRPDIRIPTGPFGVSIPAASLALEEEGYSPFMVRADLDKTGFGFVVGQDRQEQNKVVEQMLRAGWYVPMAGMMAETRALLTALDPHTADLIARGIGKELKITMEALFSGELESELEPEGAPLKGISPTYFGSFALGLLFGQAINNSATGVFYELRSGEAWADIYKPMGLENFEKLLDWLEMSPALMWGATMFHGPARIRRIFEAPAFGNDAPLVHHVPRWQPYLALTDPAPV